MAKNRRNTHTHIYIHIPTISPLRGIVGVKNGYNNGEYIVNPLTMVKYIVNPLTIVGIPQKHIYIYIHTYYGGSHNGGTPIAGWFIEENPV